MPYVYPFNSNIQFWELPPIARDGRYKKDKYLKEINASRFDLVIILSCNRFAMTSDCWLAKQFEEIKTPVIFARTKVDESVEQGKVLKFNFLQDNIFLLANTTILSYFGPNFREQSKLKS